MTKCTKCDKRALYNYIGGVSTLCADHAIDNGIIYCSMCSNKATHGLLVDNIPKTCSIHKQLDYHDLTYAYCKCGNRANYGLERDRIALTCAKHKDITHICLQKNKCYCGKNADHGLASDKKPVRCLQHKLPYHVYLMNKCVTCGSISKYQNKYNMQYYCKFHIKQSNDIERERKRLGRKYKIENIEQ